jgi:hypothetical protein
MFAGEPAETAQYGIIKRFGRGEGEGEGEGLLFNAYPATFGGN